MLPELTPDEKLVYDTIVNCNGRVTQQQIAKLHPNLGSHSRHEGYMSTESTLRKIRQIVRDLIMKHNLFIGADGNGYYIISTPEQKKSTWKDLRNKPAVQLSPICNGIMLWLKT